MDRNVLRIGDRVETTEEIKDLSFANPIPVGTKGKLTKMYRVQNGWEIWSMWLDAPIPPSIKFLVSVNNEQVKKL
jgi:hypothetical protein